jgi:uncharacterized membrane protein YebE (DUF533 family)
MVDTRKLLDALVERGMTASSQQRIESSLQDDALAGILEQQFGVSRAPVPTQAGASKVPAKVPVPAPAPPENYSIRPSEAPKDRAAPGRPAGGGKASDQGGLFGKTFKQGAGAGALALLASIALRALSGASKKGASKSAGGLGLLSGLSDQASAPEQQQVQSIADLTIKAMINAAKADGRIDEDEFQKIVGELQVDSLSPAERNFLMEEVRKPMCTAEIVQAVPDRQVAAQLYAASLLAIEVDTPGEKAYLQQLAAEFGLDSRIVAQIHTTLGVG